MRFSERYGYRDLKKVLQHEDINITTRNLIWNIISLRINEDIGSNYKCKKLEVYSKMMWQYFFKKTFDTIPSHNNQLVRDMKDYFFNCPWYDALDFLEVFPQYYNMTIVKKSNFYSKINDILEQENSAYRFVEEKIVEINNKIEIESIESAFKLKPTYSTVRVHLEAALNLLSDKENPDYRNSVKESISAVEAMCKLLTNDKKATLGKALNQLEKTKGLHPALKESYKKLYGYTSDGNGIRHALTNESIIDYKEAIFMLISCSAFINYLKSN